MGPLLGLWAFVSLWKLLHNQDDLETSWLLIRKVLTGENAFILIIFIGLMLLNWWLEIRKWQILVMPYEKVRFFDALKAVMGSLAFGIATPNRIGEYGFRSLYLMPENRKTGVLLTILSSLAQLVFTLTFGVLAVTYWLAKHPAISQAPSFSLWLLLSILLLLITGGFLFIAFFKLSLLYKLSERIRFLRTIVPSFEAVKLITISLRIRVLLLSSLRYAVFIMQYILIWKFFDAGLTWQESSITSAIIFLLMAFVPTIALAELGIRGQVSVWVAGIFTQNYLAIVTGTTLIWVINLFLPALFGSLLLWSFRVKRTKQ